MTNDLSELYEQLKTTSFDLFQFEGDAFTVGCEISLTDTYIAGLTDCIIKGFKVKSSDLEGLKNPFLFRGNNWMLGGTKQIDLEPYPDLLKLASLLETLRGKLLRVLGQPGIG